MKLTRSGRTVTKPAKFATSGVVDKVNVVAGLVDNKANVVTTMMDSNKVNMVATMMDRVESNVGLVVDKDGSKTRNILQANQSKSSFLIPVDSLQKQTEKATYIVRLPEKTEVERLKEEFMEVEEDVDDPMAQPEQEEAEEEEEKEKEDFSEAGVVFDGAAVENHPEVDTINQFSLSHIPIEVIQEGEGGVDEEEFEEEEEEREKTEEEEEEWQEREEGRLSLVRQLGLLQEQQQREEEEISDHVISIEENGHITIEQVSNPISYSLCLLTKTCSIAQVHEEHSPPPHILPPFPEWWRRISSTFLSFLSTGHLVDLWLVCSDGEAVPAHLLILAHASPYLSAVLANAARDTQEDAVTLSLPDWDSHTVGQFVSALYQGQLPEGMLRDII